MKSPKKKEKRVIEKSPLPTRSKSHIQEDQSLVIFRQSIGSWIVHDIKGNSDYGIDVFVEITKDKLKSEGKLVTGKKFNVQLKSTNKIRTDSDLFVSVKRTSFLYWYQCTEPVLIALIDLNKGDIYFRWIDEKLKTEINKRTPNWHANDSLTIRFEKKQVINAKSLVSIEAFVYKWTYQPKKVITPGEYYNQVDDAIAFVNKFKSITVTYNFTEFNPQIEQNLSEISDSIFNICIIGPSRVGKSTLINALTYREMSPVDTLPTTGVPIVLLPGHPEEVCVHFMDGSNEKAPVSLEFISEYADQKKNKHNHKNVSLVNVKINSDFLEKGFSITDVPGIDDINEKIKNIAKSTIYSANAILYVISVAPHKEGEFKITDRHLADLREIKDKINRVFLVFNKVDTLNKSQMATLKDYINTTLADYSISEMLAHEPIYISSKKSFEKRVLNKSGVDTVSYLENLIVKYLINCNLTGISNLLSNFAASLELIRQMLNVSDVRLCNTDKSTQLQTNIYSVREELTQLKNLIKEKRAYAYNEIESYVIENFQNVISTLEGDLNRRKTRRDFPKNQEIVSYLKEESDLCVSNVYEYVQQVMYELQSEVNSWVGQKLKQVQINENDINADSTLNLPSIEKFTGRIFNIFKVREDLSSNVLVTAFNFVGNSLYILFEGFFNLFRSEETLKKENINAIILPARASFSKIQKDFLNAISDHLSKVCRSIETKTVERSNIYLDTLQQELNKIGYPLSNKEKTDLTNLKSELQELDNSGTRKMTAIRDYANGIL